MRTQAGTGEMLTHCVDRGISRMKQEIHCLQRAGFIFGTDTVALPTVQKITRKICGKGKTSL